MPILNGPDIVVVDQLGNLTAIVEIKGRQSINEETAEALQQVWQSGEARNSWLFLIGLSEGYFWAPQKEGRPSRKFHFNWTPPISAVSTSYEITSQLIYLVHNIFSRLSAGGNNPDKYVAGMIEKINSSGFAQVLKDKTVLFGDK